MKKLLIIILISMIGLRLETRSEYNDKKSWQFNRNKYLEKPNQNIQLLVLTTDILNEVREDSPSKNAIKKIERNIVHLNRIKQHLGNLEKTEDENQEESIEEIHSYKKQKHSLIKKAQKNLNALIRIEYKLIRLEKNEQRDYEKEKSIHKKHKENLIEELQQKIDHLLEIERKLVELTRKYPKQRIAAETIYYETETLKGPEIHDRETMDIEHAQYRDHLHKDISEYSDDYHDKIGNYFYSNT